MSMNKKAAIGVGLIPIIFGALIILSLSAQYSVAHNNEKFSSDITEVAAKAKFSQQYIKEEIKIITKEVIVSCGNQCNNPDVLAQIAINEAKERELFYANENAGNLFGKFRTGDFFLSRNPGKNYKIEIDGLTIFSEVKYNKITRSFSICMLFDSQGNFVSDCQDD